MGYSALDKLGEAPQGRRWSAHPDSDDVDLHGHEQAVQQHQQGGDAEAQVLDPHVVIHKQHQLDGLCDEGQDPVNEQRCQLQNGGGCKNNGKGTLD